MKAAGAQVIIALCHGSIDTTPWTHGMENAALHLAHVDGIDVVLTGHTHDQFPNDRDTATKDVNPTRGLLHAKPAVMARFYGSHLGVVELDLVLRDHDWDIENTAVKLRRADTQTKQSVLQAKMHHDLAPVHAQTLAYVRQPIAQTLQPLDSHFANVGHDAPLALLGAAMQSAISEASRDHDWAKHPILADAAQFRGGARGGPAHYINIPKGEIALRDASAIYPFSNRLYAVKRTGAQIKAWLNQSARIFRTIIAGQQSQDPFRPDYAPYDFDVMFGLTYEFDLSRDENRVRNIRHEGRPIGDTDVFIVATNSYRANGGGKFLTATPEDIFHITTRSTRDILIDYLRDASPISPSSAQNWAFTAIPDTRANFLTSPKANANAKNLRATGRMVDGFAEFALMF